MTQPPYGDEGYRPDPDSNDPGVPSGNEGRAGARSTYGRANPADESGDLEQGWGLEAPGAAGGQDEWGGYGHPGFEGGHAAAGQPGSFGQPSQSVTPGGQGAGGMSTKTLAIVGGAVVLVLAIPLVLGFVIFGGSEERDRKAVVSASNDLLDTIRTSDKFSDFNDLLCPEYRVEDDVAEELDAELASMGYTLGDLYDDPTTYGEITDRDVEFPSDERREAIVNFDDSGYGSGWKFSRVGGDWLFCEFDYSDVSPSEFY